MTTMPASRSDLGTSVVADLDVDRNLLEAIDQPVNVVVVLHQPLHRPKVATEQAPKHWIEEQHRLAAQRLVRSTRFQEHHCGACETTELDLARHELDQLVARVRLEEAVPGHDNDPDVLPVGSGASCTDSPRCGQ